MSAATSGTVAVLLHCAACTGTLVLMGISAGATLALAAARRGRSGRQKRR